MTPRKPIVSVPYAYSALTGGGWVDEDSVVRLATSTDKVGIGTSSPEKKLHIDCGSTRDGIRIDSDGSSTVYSDITQKVKTEASVPEGKPKSWTWSLRKDGDFSGDETGPTLELYAPKMGGGYLAPLVFKTNGDVVLAGAKNATNGNVGIGTNNPIDKLEVKGNSGITITSPEPWLRFDETDVTDKNGEIMTRDGRLIFGFNNDVWNNWSEKATILDNGYVGIGTWDPDERLCIWNPQSVHAVGFRFQTPPDDSGGPCMKFGRTRIDLPAGKASAKIAFMGWPAYHGGLSFLPEGKFFFSMGYPGPGNPQEDPDDQTRLVTIDVSGNVGIGTTDPQKRLHIFQNGVDPFGDPGIRLQNNVGNAWDLLSGTYSLGTNQSDQFGIYDVTNDTLALTIKSNGDVGIGTAIQTAKLHVKGNIKAELNNLNGQGSLYSMVWNSWSGEIGYTSSSKRYKENIRNLEIDPQDVLRLQPVKFNWKTTGQEDIGLIAEDVDQVIPDLVIYDKDGQPDAVKYDKVAIYLLELVKAQQERISALEKQIAELRK